MEILSFYSMENYGHILELDSPGHGPSFKL